MTSAPLAIGIIGCGRMGRVHATTCRSLGHAIAFVWDEAPEHAHALSTDCGGVPVVAIDAIDWASVDAVVVCTPPSARGPVERRAAQEQTSFFVEKPVGLSAGHVRDVEEALRGSSAIHSVGYMNRYRTSVRRAREALTGQEIVGVSALWAAGPYTKRWWSNPLESGGGFNEQCTHFVDLFRYFLGEIEDVAALPARHDGAGSIGVVCRFASGVCGTLLYSSQSTTKQMSLRLICRDGSVELDGYDLTFGDCTEPVSTAWAAEMETFCSAVAAHRQDIVESSFLDAVRTQTTVDAVRHAVATGATVKVHQAQFV